VETSPALAARRGAGGRPALARRPATRHRHGVTTPLHQLPARAGRAPVLAALTLLGALAAGCVPTPSAGSAPASAAAGSLLVLNKAAASASILDVRTGATLATLPTGEGPHEVAVSPDGRLAVVTNYGAPQQPGSTLTLLDLAARRPLATIDVAPLRRPHGVAWLPDGRRVAVTFETDSLVALVDVIERRVVARVRTNQGGSHMLALSRDGARAYVANIGSGTVSMLDLEGRYLQRTTATGAGAEGIALSPEGARLWVTNRAANTVTVLDAETLTPVDTLRSADFPIRVAFTPNGRLALVTNARSGTLRLFDAARGDSVATIALPVDSTRTRGTMLGTEFGRGTGVPIGVLVGGDGRTAYVANANADLVTVVDLAARRVTGYLTTGREPDGLAWVPAARPTP
jgi:YVTN family beta-propeller protein